jgi:DNA mismatch repair protein MutS
MSIILAQSGFFVPCSSFVFKPYKEIFTRILGNDDIFKGLSTFAVEMSELSCILKSANKNSLVLGDELCSGTETTSALCIFTAGVMMLHQKNTSFIFATHFHEVIENQEIKNLERLELQHMVVKYDTEKEILIYDRKIRKGAGNKLYGLEVCKSLSMPQEFLHIANRLRCETQPTILNSDQSRYNSNKIRYKCEFCDNIASEIHHMKPQEDAVDGFIGSHHKNHKANLCSICKECHLKITKNKIKHTRVKTSDGSELYTVPS